MLYPSKLAAYSHLFINLFFALSSPDKKMKGEGNFQ